MSLEFKLPEVSEGVTSVDVAEVRVKEGDVITSGAVVCEVETDKAVAEINCPHAGKVSKVLIKSGDKISVGQPILVIESAGAASAPAPAAKQAPAAAAPAPVAAPAPASPTPAAPVASGPVEFRLPEVSEGVTKVDVASVAVKVGSTITAGAVVCEVETDKAVAEITCPHAGTVTAVHVTPGTSIKIGDLLLTINATAGAPSAAPAAPAPKANTEAVAPKASAPAPVATASAAPSATGAARADGPPAPAGPATRRLARKLGVNLKLVKGSAAGGRITIEDVEAYVRDRMAQPSVPSAAAAPGFGIVQAQPLPDFSKFGPVEKQPMNKIFRTAASNLHAAWVTIPHVTQHDLADITELEAARKRYVKANANSPKITMTAIMIKAVVGALKAFPNFNSSVDMVSGELVVKQYYHIGVAVDTPNGLVVPVIRNCDQKNILQVAAELTEIATKARDRKLKTEDMQGGTFTITNLGGIGGTAFTPIVNYPEVAILGMSRSINQLVLENGQVTERMMLPLSLSYDHRAINGADAARFIVKLSGSLTNFLELF
ncbi:MAG: 2-oxo acid dehydrogenase subunit E2 [Planctomycetaceae bacterium]|nr:2-oxo acid dehydrogenase subunit E2 [Planctomycetaceae bacterium]